MASPLSMICRARLMSGRQKFLCTYDDGGASTASDERWGAKTFISNSGILV